ncbi:alpha-1,4-glucan--maltose-1-phosphate maltosyltransferase [Hansschlegelia plantiphila]|uniref:Alpha-1,4-glucan:maltose-1-phosphate maltosyltransferase n=1 Tax=Hansschlegelia plantiphila TaxID=374655 RepID=A0A9W6MUG4_9HYPH|nr:alpha-1,4-glucan--maltose-1-phosphate maltosyltransferase [Hansschlegelia plantiphila]GLK67374.1 alpha-1,4-glucan:maltose-1-phosphate maltosyltransferase [Hansschlegelia plantiphila]
MLQASPDAADAATRPRIAIEAVTPTVDGGRFPVKTVVARSVTVEADVFADGHEVLRADVLWRGPNEQEFRREPMTFLLNDRWRAAFTPEQIGRHDLAIEAWWDEFGTFRRDLTKKREAGLDVALETDEGLHLLEEAAANAPADLARALSDIILKTRALDTKARVEALLSPETHAAAVAADPHHFASRTELYPVDVERREAGFASWYELFPRSESGDPTKHGTFRDVIKRLPMIRDMGFDVLYFPPIHPIGITNRKGPNNTLTPGPSDVGSPYAIGDETGGHDAIHSELGSLDDFRALVKAAVDHDLEIALDFAIQCSPDHPWLKEHPGWFKWRPDGSMKYAENPPKKYQDIVNVDFYGPDAIPGLWQALRDVVLFWIDQGVTIFRVDNPHTKPLPFWEWMIGDVRARHPEAMFLSEAFTRPKVMYRLAKVGYSQSYTYFTWRNQKYELMEYLTELSTTAPKDFFRPNFFVNTPDINPFFLQTSGRAGFLIRAALATTLSGLWGMYSGFEICESAPLPGKEEYLDSEKFQIRTRNWNQPGNIVQEITRLNRIRRENPALQSHLDVHFHNCFDDAVLYFSKSRTAADGAGIEDMILVFISLDPHDEKHAPYELPLWEFGLPDGATVQVEDLMRGNSFTLTGKSQWIYLNPNELPFHVWRVTRPAGVA